MVTQPSILLIFLYPPCLSKMYPCTFRSNHSTSHSHIQHLTMARHQCPHCSETFHTERMFHLHVSLIHDQTPVHHCPHCRCPYATAVELNRHLNTTHTKPARYQCPLCTCTFNTKFQVQQHAVDHIRYGSVERAGRMGEFVCLTEQEKEQLQFLRRQESLEQL